MPTEPVSVIHWRRLDTPGKEVARLSPQGDGWILSGIANFVEDGHPATLSYDVTVDSRWHTKSCLVSGILGEHPIELHVEVDRDQRWSVNGTACPEVAGCLDIDLVFSPVTNTLPIRRLNLPVGKKTTVTTAWVTPPSTTLSLLTQEYHHVSTNRYDYRAGDFTATIHVRDNGLVTDYSGLWKEDQG